MTTLIDIQNVTKIYRVYDRPTDRLKESMNPIGKKYHREFTALSNISISINAGESVGIVGTNGSGKSTLLKMIAGIVTPTSGTIKTNGKVSAILELGAGFNPEYSGIENIYLNGTIMGYSKKEIDKKIESITEFADIGEFISQPVKTYSSGMFARLAFAVAINVEPEILIVDEALSVGDTKFQIKCIEKMKEIRENGTTILFVSHAIEQIRRFCTRAIWIEKGALKADGDANDVVNKYEDSLYIDSARKSEIHERDIEISPSTPGTVGRIVSVICDTKRINTFETLQVKVVYDIFEEHVANLLIGVAIYDRDRKFIFGPNTYLDDISIPHKKGRHTISYRVQQIKLLSGTYFLDAGLFTEKGVVVIDYKTEAEQFVVSNKYFTEGLVYMEHEWRVNK